MKTLISISAAAALLAMSVQAQGEGAKGPKLKSKGGTSAGLAWRCGKNNPAMWGTFGNGCLKQRRKAKQGNAAKIKKGKSFKAK